MICWPPRPDSSWAHSLLAAALGNRVRVRAKSSVESIFSIAAKKKAGLNAAFPRAKRRFADPDLDDFIATEKMLEKQRFCAKPEATVLSKGGSVLYARL